MPGTVVPETVLAVLGPDGPALADPSAPLLRADDLGVLRGESAFETVRVAAGRPAFLSAHLARLRRSADRLTLAPRRDEDWAGLVRVVVAAWDRPDGSLRLVSTGGGVGFALLSAVPVEAVRGRERGVRVVTLTLGVAAGVRSEAPWLLGGVKSTSYAVNMAALRQAKAAEADDAVFVSSDGEVLEAPTATVAWVRGGTLVTPPPDGVGILAGTTMEVVLGLCAELGIASQVRRGTVTELLEADEVLLTGSVRGVAPVVALDGRPLEPGPVTVRLRDAFERRVVEDR